MHTRLSSQVIRFILFASGPRWKRKNSIKLLWASRRHDASWRRKHSGNIADGLRCSTWRRAQTPGKMTHHISGTDNKGRGNIALVHPSKISRLQPDMLAKHSILAFLLKKISCFVHDCHPYWIAHLWGEVCDDRHLVQLRRGKVTPCHGVLSCTLHINHFQVCTFVHNCAHSISLNTTVCSDAHTYFQKNKIMCTLEYILFQNK